MIPQGSTTWCCVSIVNFYLELNFAIYFEDPKSFTIRVKTLIEPKSSQKNRQQMFTIFFLFCSCLFVCLFVFFCFVLFLNSVDNAK